jgi:hypothetical protein
MVAFYRGLRRDVDAEVAQRTRAGPPSAALIDALPIAWGRADAEGRFDLLVALSWCEAASLLSRWSGRPPTEPDGVEAVVVEAAGMPRRVVPIGPDVGRWRRRPDPDEIYADWDLGDLRLP